jgi:hypothetical protein
VLVPSGSHYLIHSLLVRFIGRVLGFRTIIEVELVFLWIGQMVFQVVNQDSVARWPVRGDAARAAENLWVLADGLTGDEPTHTRPHDKRVLTVRQRSIGLIDKWLQFAYEKSHLVV